MTEQPAQPSAIDRETILAFLAKEFPQVFGENRSVEIEGMRRGFVKTRLSVNDTHLRPGGTVSGPTMMMLVDCAAYIAVMTVLGPAAMAVTTNLNINFLRMPPKSDIICEASVLKAGRSLFVLEATIFGAEDTEQKSLAHATCTYSIPPKQ